MNNPAKLLMIGMLFSFGIFDAYGEDHKVIHHPKQSISYSVPESNLSMAEVPSCGDLPLDLENCQASLCYDQAPFGKIYRKILGQEHKKCKYQERVESLGGLDCSFPMDHILKITTLLNKHYDTLYIPSLILSSEQIDALKTIYTKYCSILPHSSFPSIVTIKDKKYGGELYQITKMNIASVKNMISSKHTLASKQLGTVNGLHSLMFTDHQVQNILAAIAYYTKIEHLAHELLQEKHTTKTIPKIISFYLNSIIYLASDSWAIWLNNYRVGDTALFGTKSSSSPKSNPDDVEIIRVTPNHVTFLWNTKNLDQISPGWQLRLKKEKEYYVTEDQKIKIYQAGPKDTDIYFTLGPNQTFVVDALSIIEGMHEE